MNYFLPTAKISKDQGKLFWWGKKLIIPTYHPAAALRSTTVMEELERNFKKIPAAVRKYEMFVADRGGAISEPQSAQKSLF